MKMSDLFKMKWHIKQSVMDGADYIYTREAWEQFDFKMRRNESVLALKREGAERLTTGEISRRTENNPNLPPSVAREGGHEYYWKCV